MVSDGCAALRGVRVGPRVGVTGGRVMSDGATASVVVAVAEVLGNWLDDLGFVFAESIDGQDAFLIAKWDLPDPSFAAESQTDLT